MSEKGKEPSALPPAPGPTLAPGQTTQGSLHKTLWLGLGVFFVLTVALASWKGYQGYLAYREVQDMFSVAPLRLPEREPGPSKEMAGILADSLERSPQMRVPGKDTSQPDLETAQQALGVSREILPVMAKFKEDPVVKEMVKELRADPEFDELLKQFQKDMNVFALIKGAKTNPNFQVIMGKYLRDPRFLSLMDQLRRQGHDGLPRAIPPAGAGSSGGDEAGQPSQRGTVLGVSGEATVDIEAVSGRSQEKKVGSAPPPPPPLSR